MRRSEQSFGSSIHGDTSGLSMVELLVAVAISSIMMLGIYGLLVKQVEVSKYFDDQLERQRIVAQFMRAISCERTISKPPPSIGAQIDLVSSHGAVIGGGTVSSTGSDFDGARQVGGDYYYKAYYGGVDGINVHLARRSKLRTGWFFAKSASGVITYDFTYGATRPIIGGSNARYRLCSGQSPGALQLVNVDPPFKDLPATIYPPGSVPDYYTGKMESVSCVSLIADPVSNAILSTTGGSQVQYPLYLMYSCNKYCKNAGYLAGWTRGCESSRRNSAGNPLYFGQSPSYYANFNGGVALQLLDQRIFCSCVK
jgi:prepilin-type N-terminal cleavage/methylation domain-containing protein